MLHYAVVFFIIALIAGVPLLLMSWGFQPRDLQLWLFNLFTEINVGTIRISIFGILGGVLLFAGGLVVTRWFQKWLDGNVMARSHVDGGVRNSVKTGVGYLGTGIAGIIGISAAGIDLSSLALVAGALSLGIDRDQLNETFWLGLGTPGSTAPAEAMPAMVCKFTPPLASRRVCGEIRSRRATASRSCSFGMLSRRTTAIPSRPRKTSTWCRIRSSRTTTATPGWPPAKAGRWPRRRSPRACSRR